MTEQAQIAPAMTNLSYDTSRQFRKLFKKSLSGTVPPLEWPFPWTYGAGCKTRCFTDVSKDLQAVYQLFSLYITSRQERRAPAKKATIVDLAYCLFVYWPCMSAKTRDDVFEILSAVHLQAISKHGICYRPEFAFLTACKQSFRWAIPHRELLRESRYGLDELQELYERVPLEKFFDVFFGHRRLVKNFMEGTWYGHEELKWEISHGSYPYEPETYDEMSCLDEINFFLPGKIDAAAIERMHRELGELVEK